MICNFPKVKKLSKDIRAIAAALEGSDLLVVSKATRVRRKVCVVLARQGEAGRGVLVLLSWLFCPVYVL